LSLSLYLHTIRFLRPAQFIGRVRFRLSKPAVDERAPPEVRRGAGWKRAAPRPQTLLGPGRFRFLNVERELIAPSDWNRSDWEKLWLYNVHYFDDLNSTEAESRNAWHESLIGRWIRENPPAQGNGWEPYPLSLRTVNWIKWALSGNPLSDTAVHSLAVQIRYLAGRLEIHLLGNHLWANAKALVFAGLFFDGKEAREWLMKGLRILDRQMPEQILPDGGHFELSPMYHNIILEDLLDLINLLQAYPDELRGAPAHTAWREHAARMLRWASTMVQPDGEIALLNDAALGIASTLSALQAYARRVGIDSSENQDQEALLHLPQSGYIRVRRGDAWAVLDVGRIGPDYIPGHAHADTLSFELSVAGRRIIVDSGTSTYQVSAERLRQRETRAHNTVEIDGASSSEVWSSFRVARRAYPHGLEMLQSNDMIRVRCAHDGYKRLKGRPVHGREWAIDNSGMLVTDTVEGSHHRAVARFHFGPECVVSGSDGRTGSVTVAGKRALVWCVEQGRAEVADSTYHPEFGLTIPTKCLQVELAGAAARTRFEWAA
jgi:uncharacterized heparinase superfamily protein